MKHFEQPGLPSMTTCTTGLGSCILDGKDISGLGKAKLYKIDRDNEWEIGFVAALTRTQTVFLPSLPRDPIISSLGHRQAVNWGAGRKNVHFCEEIPDWLAKESQKP